MTEFLIVTKGLPNGFPSLRDEQHFILFQVVGKKGALVSDRT